MDKRTKNRREGKPESRKRRVDLAELPRDDFPLSLHKASGRWYKSIQGRRIYLGQRMTRTARSGGIASSAGNWSAAKRRIRGLKKG